MKKAASIFLCAEIEMNDIELLIRWMKNPNVTRYLNEDPNVVHSLRRLSQSVPEPMLTYHFNRTERFFLVCRGEGEAIGFVKLRKTGENGAYEIVYAIGEEELWGRGYGKGAIRSALSTAFLEWRASKVVAKIYTENVRSVRSVRACGFSQSDEDERLCRYKITSAEYLRLQS